MVKNIVLSNFRKEKTELLKHISRKIVSTKISTLNEDIFNKLKIDSVQIALLLNSIESKYRKCEILYYTFFENLDHNVLSGNSHSLPLNVDCTFIDGTAKLHSIIDVDDKDLYKELIDLNFQNYIVIFASLYENIVRLVEIVIKKVIVHLENKPPLSSPLHDYIEYLNILIKLGYRKNDRLHTCINNFIPYFDKYLPTINQLRNSYMHGYSNNLSSDGYNYSITIYSKFAIGSPDLILDIFTKKLLDETKKFISDLLIALKQSIQHHKKIIPA